MSMAYEHVARGGKTRIATIVAGLLVLAGFARPAPAQEFRTDLETVAPGIELEPLFCQPPTVNVSPVPTLPLAQPEPCDQAMPINLATALCLSQARPLVIALAQTSVEKAAASSRRPKSCGCPISISVLPIRITMGPTRAPMATCSLPVSALFTPAAGRRSTSA